MSTGVETIVVQSINKKLVGKEGTTTAIDLVSTTGKVFSGYPSQIPENLSEGQSIEIRSVQGTKHDGTTFNRILSTGTNNTTSSKTNSGNKTRFGNKTKSLETSNNNSGARLGGVFHDAVQLVLHNNKNSIATTDMVAAVAKQLLQEMKNIESGQ